MWAVGREESEISLQDSFNRMKTVLSLFNYYGKVRCVLSFIPVPSSRLSQATIYLLSLSLLIKDCNFSHTLLQRLVCHVCYLLK